MLLNFTIPWNKLQSIQQEKGWSTHTLCTMALFFDSVHFIYTSHSPLYNTHFRQKATIRLSKNNKVLFQITNKCYESFLVKAATFVCLCIMSDKNNWHRKKNDNQKHIYAHQLTQKQQNNPNEKKRIKHTASTRFHSTMFSVCLCFFLILNMTACTMATMKIM